MNMDAAQIRVNNAKNASMGYCISGNSNEQSKITQTHTHTQRSSRSSVLFAHKRYSSECFLIGIASYLRRSLFVLPETSFNKYRFRMKWGEREEERESTLIRFFLCSCYIDQRFSIAPVWLPLFSLLIQRDFFLYRHLFGS